MTFFVPIFAEGNSDFKARWTIHFIGTYIVISPFKGKIIAFELWPLDSNIAFKMNSVKR